jgi:hypothetical protein
MLKGADITELMKLGNLLQTSGLLSLLILAGLVGFLLLKPQQGEDFEPRKGLPQELRHEIVEVDKGIFSALLACKHIDQIRDHVNHYLSEVEAWQPNGSAEQEIKKQEILTLEEFRSLITTRSCMEQQLRITVPETLHTKNILSKNQQNSWANFAAQEKVKLVNMMKRVDLLATAAIR